MNPSAAPLGVTSHAGGRRTSRVFSAHASAVHFCLYDEHGRTRDRSASHLTPRRRRRASRLSSRAASPARATACASTARSIPRAAIASTPPSCSPTPTRRAIDRPYRAASLDVRVRRRQRRRSCPNASRLRRARASRAASASPGTTRSSTNSTCAASPSCATDIPEAARGRFAGLAEAPVDRASDKSLGVTSVEIMPADAFVDERHLPPLGLTNAWGYNPVILGAPDPRLAPGGWAEVRAATDALHAAGLEVDPRRRPQPQRRERRIRPDAVVPRPRQRRLLPPAARTIRARYVNDMGCGNCLALDRPAGRRHGARGAAALDGAGAASTASASISRPRSGGATGASIRTRRCFSAIADDPVVSQAKLIAEPWDIGPGGYQLGNFPEAWGEWNDRFRDSARRFWRGDARLRGELATRLAGSRDIFPHAALAGEERQLHRRARRLHARRSRLLRAQAQRGQRRGQSRRVERQLFLEPRRRRPERRSRDQLGARARHAQSARAAVRLARHADARDGRGDRPQPGRQQQRLCAGQRDLLDRLEQGGRFARGVRRPPRRRCGARIRRCARAPGLPGSRFDATGLPDVEWRDANAAMTSGAQWDARPATSSSPSSRRRRRDGVDRVALAFNRGAQGDAAACPSRAPAWPGAFCIDTSDDSRVDAATETADRVEIAARSTLILAEADAPPRGAARPAARCRGHRRARRRRRHRRRMVGRQRQADRRLDVDQARAARGAAPARALCRRRRRTRWTGSSRKRARAPLPYSLTIPLDGAMKAPLRADPRVAVASARIPYPDRGRRRRSRAAFPTPRASGASWRTGARSSSARSICRRCRSAGTGSRSTASAAR